jgi:TolA-binding protein
VKPAIRNVIGLVLASSFLSGCFLWTTRGEGTELEETTENHERRLLEIEEGIRAERRQLQEEVQNAKRQVRELEEVLQKATQVVTRNSADLGLEVQEIREQLSQLEGQMAEVRNTVAEGQQSLAKQRQEIDQRLLAIAQKAGLDMPVDASEVPDDKGDHFQAAYRSYQTSDYSRSRALFREYIRRYARDDQADNAQYWIGKSYLQEERYATALSELRKVVTDFGTGDAVDDALFDMAEAFWQLHACTDARNTLNALIQGHPRSSLIRRARTKLRQVQNARRGYCTS